MGQGDFRYSIEVRGGSSLDGSSNNGSVATGALTRVYDAGTRTVSTLYADAVRTAKTNAISRAQYVTDGGRIEFYSLKSSHDISVALSDGSLGKFTVTPTSRYVVIDRGNPQKVLVAPFSSLTVETDTGLDLPYGALVQNCLIEVVDVHSAKTIMVGILSSETAGDADGFVVATLLTTAGIIHPRLYTAGSNDTFLATANSGALLGKFLVGADVVGDTGSDTMTGHLVQGSNGSSVSYTCSSATTTATGLIHMPFIQLM